MWGASACLYSEYIQALVLMWWNMLVPGLEKFVLEVEQEYLDGWRSQTSGPHVIGDGKAH